jgi:hypothetical protein
VSASFEAVLSTEIVSRESHGGESRIEAARFPSRKTLEDSVKKPVIEHLGQLDFMRGKEKSCCRVRPAPARAVWPWRCRSARASPASGSPSSPRPNGCDRVGEPKRGVREYSGRRRKLAKRGQSAHDLAIATMLEARARHDHLELLDSVSASGMRDPGEDCDGH